MSNDEKAAETATESGVTNVAPVDTRPRFWKGSLLLFMVSSVFACHRDALPPPSDQGKADVSSIEPPASTAADPWTPDRLLAPSILAKQVGGTGEHSTILYVGPEVLFKQGHIRGAIYIGPASSADGLERLTEKARGLAKDAEIVIYCGCCPWRDCPNVRPAYSRLASMGFTNVKVLDLPNNFAQNWADMGYPVAKESE